MALAFVSVGVSRAAPTAAVLLRVLSSTMSCAPARPLPSRSLDSSASVSICPVGSAMFSSPSAPLRAAVCRFSALWAGAPPPLVPSSGTARVVSGGGSSAKSFSSSRWAVAEKSPEVFKALKAREAALAAALPPAVRHPLRGSTSESFTDKIYRWLDVTGVLTRWNNRKEWVLDLVPMNRLGSSTITEFERKQEMFVTLNAQILALIALYLAYTGIQHVNVKPPNPSYEGFPGVDGRKKDFTMTNRLFFMEPKERCKECRWLDFECKKECFARLKAEGYKLFVNKGDPLSIPRLKLEPPHFH